MNKTASYAKWASGLFALIVVLTFVIIYASQAGFNVLLYGGTILTLVISFALVFLVSTSNNVNRALEQKIVEMRRQEQIILGEQKNTKEDELLKETSFDMQEKLANIVPSQQDSTDVVHYTEKVLQNIAREMNIVQGLVFVFDDSDQQFHITGEYAYFSEEQPRSFPQGETLSGQVAKSQQLLNVQDLPDGYITILSGLGKGNPRHLVIAPIVYNDMSIGVIELASFRPFVAADEELIRKTAQSIADKLNELRNNKA